MSINNTVLQLLKRPKVSVFRELLIKRRLASGEFDENWQTIPSKLVKKFGSAQFGLTTDMKPNHFVFQGMNIEVVNYNGFFNEPDDSNSFFYGCATIYNSLVRINAGYLLDVDSYGIKYGTTTSKYGTTTTFYGYDVSEENRRYPTFPVYLGVIGESIERSDSSVVKLDTDHISKIFKDFQADLISGMDTTMTASDIIAKIQNYSDSNGQKYFQKYIREWFYETTTVPYLLQTSTTLSGLSVWDLMKNLAEAENKFLYIDNKGSFIFKERPIPTSTSITIHLSGANDPNPTNGKNIIDSVKTDENIQNVYNRIKVKLGEDDTTTSYYIKNETWAWGDSSSSFLYGVREYSYENKFISTATAITIADTIYNKYRFPSQKAYLKCKYIPEIDIRDRVTLTHKNGRQVGNAFYGSAVYGSDNYGQYILGTINLDRKSFIVNHVSHNIDQFFTSLTLEEV